LDLCKVPPEDAPASPEFEFLVSHENHEEPEGYAAAVGEFLAQLNSQQEGTLAGDDPESDADSEASSFDFGELDYPTPPPSTGMFSFEIHGISSESEVCRIISRSDGTELTRTGGDPCLADASEPENNNTTGNSSRNSECEGKELVSPLQLPAFNSDRRPLIGP